MFFPSHLQTLAEMNIRKTFWYNAAHKTTTNYYLFILFLQSLVSCLGGAFLGGVIARMSKDYRHCRAGLPDLVVWNTSNNSYKVSHILALSNIFFFIYGFRHFLAPDYLNSGYMAYT